MIVFAYFNKFSPDLQMSVARVYNIPLVEYQLDFIKKLIACAKDRAELVESEILAEFGVFEIESLPAAYYEDIVESIHQYLP